MIKITRAQAALCRLALMQGETELRKIWGEEYDTLFNHLTLQTRKGL